MSNLNSIDYDLSVRVFKNDDIKKRTYFWNVEVVEMTIDLTGFYSMLKLYVFECFLRLYVPTLMVVFSYFLKP